jgi:dihydroorotate dehydrogenase electron transfer subunit
VKRVRAEILSTRRLGAYTTITLVAPEIAEKARPGQFLAVAMPQGRAFILRRHFAIHQSSRRGGWAGTLEFVVDASGPGTAWLAEARAHEALDVIGPLGKPFAYPKRLTNCLLVAEGRGAATMYFLAQELVARHARVDMVIGGSDLEGVFKPIEAKRLSQTVAVMTEDGSLGERGGVLDALPDMLERSGTEVLYAAARPATLRAIAELCVARRIPAQVAVEERMGCGYGLCFTCVVPVARKDGAGFDHLRACVEGPVFNPARIVWDRWLGGTPVAPMPGVAPRRARADEEPSPSAPAPEEAAWRA